MSDFSFKEFLNNQCDRRIATHDQAIKSLDDHKFHAHERLFRLVLNLNTLFLTGWVALATWKSHEFWIDRKLVFSACELHILSLVLVFFSDFFMIVQSSVGVWFVSKTREKFIAGFTNIEARLVGVAATVGNDHHILSSTADKEINTLNTSLSDATAKRSVKAIWVLFGLNWLFGILGALVFFIALYTSIHSMVKFVQPSPQSGTPTASPVISAPHPVPSR